LDGKHFVKEFYSKEKLIQNIESNISASY